jgi:hypothetical protein
VAWQDELVPLVRVFVNDTDATRFTDDRLEESIVAAARVVQMELAFDRVYACDHENVTITPDPTAAATRDDDFITLVAAKTGCIVDRGSAALAAEQAILVKDGTSVVDLREAFKAKLSLLEKGWCAVYADLKSAYSSGPAGSLWLGRAVVTPFRLFAGGNTAGDGSPYRSYR